MDYELDAAFLRDLADWLAGPEGSSLPADPISTLRRIADALIEAQDEAIAAAPKPEERT